MLKRKAPWRLPETLSPPQGRSRRIFRRNSQARSRQGHEAGCRLATEPHARRAADRLDLGRALRRLHGRPRRSGRRQVQAGHAGPGRTTQLAARAARGTRRRPGRGPDVHRAVLHPQRPEDDRPMRARLDQEIATPDDPAKPLWWWCDALFMAPPVFADMARATGDTKYLDFMDREWTITADLLYDKNKHLYSRDATYLDKHEKNGEKLFWSRGNGWVMGGIVRVLQATAEGFSAAAQIRGAAQGDGCRNAVSFKAKTDSGVPACSMPMRILCRRFQAAPSSPTRWRMASTRRFSTEKTYWPAVQKAWAGMLTHVYADGRLGAFSPSARRPALILRRRAMSTESALTCWPVPKSIAPQSNFEVHSSAPCFPAGRLQMGCPKPVEGFWF